jgi:hypothetical protein
VMKMRTGTKKHQIQNLTIFLYVNPPSGLNTRDQHIQIADA